MYVCISVLGKPGCTFPSRMLCDPKIPRGVYVRDSKAFKTRNDISGFSAFLPDSDKHRRSSGRAFNIAQAKYRASRASQSAAAASVAFHLNPILRCPLLIRICHRFFLSPVSETVLCTCYSNTVPPRQCIGKAAEIKLFSAAKSHPPLPPVE